MTEAKVHKYKFRICNHKDLSVLLSSACDEQRGVPARSLGMGSLQETASGLSTNVHKCKCQSRNYKDLCDVYMELPRIEVHSLWDKKLHIHPLCPWIFMQDWSTHVG